MTGGLFEPNINQFGCCQTPWWVIPGTGRISYWYLADWKQKWLVLRHKLFETLSLGDLPTATHPLKLKSECHIFHGKPTQRSQATHLIPAPPNDWVWLIPKTVEETISCSTHLCLGKWEFLKRKLCFKIFISSLSQRTNEWMKHPSVILVWNSKLICTVLQY